MRLYPTQSGTCLHEFYADTETKTKKTMKKLPAIGRQSLVKTLGSSGRGGSPHVFYRNRESTFCGAWLA